VIANAATWPGTSDSAAATTDRSGVSCISSISTRVGITRYKTLRAIVALLQAGQTRRAHVVSAAHFAPPERLAALPAIISDGANEAIEAGLARLARVTRRAGMLRDANRAVVLTQETRVAMEAAR
jgi:hypothetical protein